jgi:hypothetical protein
VYSIFREPNPIRQRHVLAALGSVSCVGLCRL